MAELKEKMYKVEVGNDAFIVKAKTKGGALKLVLEQSIKIDLLSSVEAVALVSGGATVLEAKEEE